MARHLAAACAAAAAAARVAGPWSTSLYEGRQRLPDSAQKRCRPTSDVAP